MIRISLPSVRHQHVVLLFVVILNRTWAECALAATGPTTAISQSTDSATTAPTREWTRPPPRTGWDFIARDVLEDLLFKWRIFFVMLFAPFWLPAVGWWLRVRTAEGLREWCGYFAIASAFFMLLNCGDRSPLQWTSASILMGSLTLYGGARLNHLITRDLADRRRRRAASERGADAEH
ncbi:MAG TPA: hypothetical protein VEA69_25070 [Tepidisphaeraceae bacterium]|nr:hypothetical protein [Tepidisphaeraceae bacterium]